MPALSRLKTGVHASLPRRPKPPKATRYQHCTN